MLSHRIEVFNKDVPSDATWGNSLKASEILRKGYRFLAGADPPGMA
jgi:hypothetical protein